MKASSFLILLLLQCSIVFSQTLQPDIYEPNNTMNDAAMIEKQGGLFGKVDSITANFHDATDTSDWYSIRYVPNLALYPPLLLLKFHIELLDQSNSSQSISNFTYEIQLQTPPVSESGEIFTNDIPPKKFINPGDGIIDFTFLLSLYTGPTRPPASRLVYINVHHKAEDSTKTSYKLSVIPVILAPKFVDFFPKSGPPGTKVKIVGRSLFYPNRVMLNGVSTAFIPSNTIHSLEDTTNLYDTITTAIPPYVPSGRIIVAFQYGSIPQIISNSDFTVTLPLTHPIKDSVINNSSILNENDSTRTATKNDVALKGSTGKLYLDLPAYAECVIYIYNPGTNKEIAGATKDRSFYLAPGKYNIIVSSVKMQGIEIQKGVDTRIKAGVLNITAPSPTSWALFNENKKIRILGSSGPKKIGLPVGNYQVQMNSGFYPITIRDGETKDF